MLGVMPSAFHDGRSCVSEMMCSGSTPRATAQAVRWGTRRVNRLPTLRDVRPDARLVQIPLAVRLDVHHHRIIVPERLLCKKISSSTPQTLRYSLFAFS